MLPNTNRTPKATAAFGESQGDSGPKPSGCESASYPGYAATNRPQPQRGCGPNPMPPFSIGHICHCPSNPEP